MKIKIEIFQENNHYVITRNFEYENLRKLIGYSCSEIFSFYQKSDNSLNKNILNTKLPIDIAIYQESSLLFDTRKTEFNQFRDRFKFSSKSSSKRQFARNILNAVSLIMEKDASIDKTKKFYG